MRETADFHDSLIRERRYALLQAAAVIEAVRDPNYRRMDTGIREAVDAAEALLAEIEKREKDKQ